MLGLDWYLVCEMLLRMAILSDQRQGFSNGPITALLAIDGGGSSKGELRMKKMFVT